MAYSDKRDSSIYHLCENCTVGSAIPPAVRRDGAPSGADLCAECDGRQVAGTCSSTRSATETGGAGA